jgi:hypothetical protein
LEGWKKTIYKLYSLNTYKSNQGINTATKVRGNIMMNVKINILKLHRLFFAMHFPVQGQW